MRLTIRRYIAPLMARVPDLSEMPARKRILIGIAASVLLHVLAILLLVLLTSLFPKSDGEAPAPPREIELTMVPNEPPPEPILPLAPNPQQQFLDQTGLDISKVAPEHPDFESSENGVAASEAPGKGDIPLPDQNGRESPFMAFKSQRALFGAEPKPFPADPETTSLKTPPPEPDAATAQQDVALKPAPEPPPQPQKPEKVNAPATPAPVATPPPRSIEKTDTPDIAQATPPPLKVVEKAKEDEIAIATKPPATPPPSTAETEQPQPKPVPTPVPPDVAPRPTPVMRQAMLFTPAPRVHPPAQTNSQVEQEQNRIEGSISNRGRRSANTVATPLGKYKKQVHDAIGSRWQYYVDSHRDVVALGSARVSFLVDSAGRVHDVRVENNTSNQSFADICESAIREAELPEPPADPIAPMRDGYLPFSFSFTLYTFQ